MQLIPPQRVEIVLSHNVSEMYSKELNPGRIRKCIHRGSNKRLYFPFSLYSSTKEGPSREQAAISSRNRGALPVSQFPIRRVVRSDLRRASIRGRFTILSVPAAGAPSHDLSVIRSGISVGIVWLGEIENGKFTDKF